MATLTKTFNPEKFQKSITKSITGISTGFNDPTDWVSSGNYVLNKKMSGSFDYAAPLGKVTMVCGESGSGKSYITSGNMTKDAQRQGFFVLLIDTENALDQKWLEALGVETTPDKLMRISVSMVDEVAKIIHEFTDQYKKDFMDLAEEERPKVLIIIDSLGNLLTPTDIDQFKSGDMKGDMGRKSKQLKALLANCSSIFESLPIGMVVTNHVYTSQNMFDPDDKISGGKSILFIPSITLILNKLKLKEDEEGNKIGEVTGIRSMAQIFKSRYNKPFEKVEVRIPYDRGMDPYSGLTEFFEKEKLLSKEGHKLKYEDVDGNIHKYYRKEYNRNTDGILDMMMEQYDLKRELNKNSSDKEVEPDIEITEEEE